MKHYMDIENLREQEERIGDMVRLSNTGAFEAGDRIQITEKYDGSNASIENVNGEIQAFSRKNPITCGFTLNGFYEYVQCLIAQGFSMPEGIVIFGEWSGARNKIVYEKKNIWLVFDIFDRSTESYWTQDQVKNFCNSHGLEYIHELYFGPFISWNHCRTFSHMPAYGQKQEGIVIKNQDKLTAAADYCYLKIVNSDFKERNRVPKETTTPAKMEEEAAARVLLESIVTRNRVEKMLFKLRDEGIIGNELTPKDMGTVARYLPRRIYEDCLKEEMVRP